MHEPVSTFPPSSTYFNVSYNYLIILHHEYKRDETENPYQSSNLNYCTTILNLKRCYLNRLLV